MVGNAYSIDWLEYLQNINPIKRLQFSVNAQKNLNK